MKQKQVYIKEKRLPLAYVISHAVILAVIGIASIIFQILMIVKAVPNASFAYGIWGGAACLFLTPLPIVLGIIFWIKLLTILKKKILFINL
jgi:hypothetical protein